MKREKDVNKLGELLRSGRLAKELPLSKLSSLTGISEGSLVGLEKGQWQKVDPEKLRLLAQALGLNGRDLFVIAGLMPDEELPTVTGLLHARYRSLPTSAVKEIDAFVEFQLGKHGIRPDQAGHEQQDKAS